MQWKYEMVWKVWNCMITWEAWKYESVYVWKYESMRAWRYLCIRNVWKHESRCAPPLKSERFESFKLQHLYVLSDLSYYKQISKIKSAKVYKRKTKRALCKQEGRNTLKWAYKEYKWEAWQQCWSENNTENRTPESKNWSSR